MRSIKTLAAIAVFIAASAAPGRSQSTSDSNPMIGALQDGNTYLRQMITAAADQMSPDDYSFRPTSDVRTFGELLSHIADTNFFFCAAAKAEEPPVSGIEKKSGITRSEIQKELANSFEYCDSAYQSATVHAAETVALMGQQRAPAAVLTFRNYHGLLHYGNVITYMRLRGKVPPSSQMPEMK